MAEVAKLNEIVVPTEAEVDQALGEYSSISAMRSNLRVKISAYLTAARTRQANLHEATSTGNFDCVAPLEQGIVAAIAQDLADLKIESENYEKKSKLENNRIAEVAELNELKDRQRLRDGLNIVLSRHCCLERHRHLAECSKIVGTQQLSTVMTAMRRQLVTNGMEKRLRDEVCKLNLGYLPLEVQDESRDGHSYLGVNLESVVPVANEKILSEGEQRALALAAFLAEVAADTSLSGLIIDDPVSSLDHQRMRSVAVRLVQEAAKGRQVIIFTHNILFFNEVLDAAAAADPQVPSIKRIVTKSTGGKFGIVSETDEPWIAQKVTGRIARLQQRRKVLDAFDDLETDEYRIAARSFYTDLRETWERLVEELLLGGVVERFNCGVKTQSLKAVLVDDNDYRQVFVAMKRASEWSGHDMAAGKNIPVPTPSDIKGDLDRIEAYRTTLVGRRKQLAKAREALEQPPQAEVI
jgi:hypothetical protein